MGEGKPGEVRHNLKTGEGRYEGAKESNYRWIENTLMLVNGKYSFADVTDAAKIFGTQLGGRPVEIQRPVLVDSAALRQRSLRDATAVMITREDRKPPIDVYLDTDQLKHQPPEHKIGTRVARGGTKFTVEEASPEWHCQNTLAYMAEWAHELGAMAEGQKVYFGQKQNVNGIHYEGYCLLAEGRKNVLFHCYPHE